MQRTGRSFGGIFFKNIGAGSGKPFHYVSSNVFSGFFKKGIGLSPRVDRRHCLFFTQIFHFLDYFFNQLLLFFLRLATDPRVLQRKNTTRHTALALFGQKAFFPSLTAICQSVPFTVRNEFCRSLSGAYFVKNQKCFWCFFCDRPDRPASGFRLRNRFGPLGNFSRLFGRNRTWDRTGDSFCSDAVCTPMRRAEDRRFFHRTSSRSFLSFGFAWTEAFRNLGNDPPPFVGHFVFERPRRIK